MPEPYRPQCVCCGPRASHQANFSGKKYRRSAEFPEAGPAKHADAFQKERRAMDDADTLILRLPMVRAAGSEHRIILRTIRHASPAVPRRPVSRIEITICCPDLW